MRPEFESASPAMPLPPWWVVGLIFAVGLALVIWPTEDQWRRRRQDRARKRADDIIAAHRRAEERRRNPPHVDPKQFLTPWWW